MTFQPATRVALVDDDDDFRAALAERLDLAGFKVEQHRSADAALRALDPAYDGVVVSDLRMPGMDGRQLAQKLAVLDPDLPVVLMTGHGDVAEAVEAMKRGAYDFLTKPFAPERLLETLGRALEKRALVLDNRRLAAMAQPGELAIPFLGESRAVERLRAAIAQLAEADVDVLIEGETGAGKEAVARAIHAGGRRRTRAFVPVACNALSDADATGRLFGHQAGAFQGALRHREGLVARANQGSLFLDQIDEAPAEAQHALLRVVEEREILPLGASEPVGLDLRILAATKRPATEAVAAGVLREDLYYRLNVVRLRAPPLRERREDIPLLFAHFLDRAARRMGREPPAISHPVRRRLLDHDWPGNLRELSNLASQVAVGLETAHDGDAAGQTLADRVQRYEGELIREALDSHRGDATAVADALGLPRKTLYDKLAKHGLKPASFRR